MTVDGLLTVSADLTTESLRGPEPSASVSRLTEAQTAEIGALYWWSYPAGEAGSSEAESVADIAASFAGAYGTLLDAASLGAFVDGRLAAVVLTVRRPIWPDTPDGPFVIELFTSPERRRSHLAASLLQQVLIVAAAAGETTVGLRVRSDNTPAIALYRSQASACSRHPPP